MLLCACVQTGLQGPRYGASGSAAALSDLVMGRLLRMDVSFRLSPYVMRQQQEAFAGRGRRYWQRQGRHVLGLAYEAATAKIRSGRPPELQLVDQFCGEGGETAMAPQFRHCSQQLLAHRRGHFVGVSRDEEARFRVYRLA